MIQGSSKKETWLEKRKKNTKKNIILDLNAKRKMIDFPNLPQRRMSCDI